MIESDLKDIRALIDGIEGSIPVVKELRADIFSISGFPHYETVLSNWFSYFFESNNCHGLTGLFADSFKEILSNMGSNESLVWLTDKVHVIQEVSTKKSNFIDMVIYDEVCDGEQSFENALIIEHKVGADLYNDLEDYYNSINCEDEKQGVVLSAKPIAVKNKNYFNITYNELLSAIENNLGKYTVSVDLHFLGYLQDFINNLERMSESKNTDALKFCFDHGETIERISELKRSMEDEIANSLRSSLEETEFYFFRKNPTTYSLKSRTDGIVLLLEFGKLFSQHQCDFTYWIQGELVKKWNNVPDHSGLENRFGKEFQVRAKKQGKEWIELLRGKIDFSYVEELDKNFNAGLVDFLKEKVNPINEFVREEINTYNK